MKVLVCGDRNFNDEAMLWTILDRHGDITEIIEGEARGADTLARIYGEENDIEVKKFPADWETYGKAAGPIRNKQMLDEGKPDLVIAFLAENSKGTANMIEQATKAGIPVEIINI